MRPTSLFSSGSEQRATFRDPGMLPGDTMPFISEQLGVAHGHNQTQTQTDNLLSDDDDDDNKLSVWVTDLRRKTKKRS